MTIDEFVRDACALADDPEAKRGYVKMMRSAVRAMRDIGLHIKTPVKSKKLVVKDNLTVVMPQGCTDVIQAGKLVIYSTADQFVYPLGKQDLSGVRPYELIVKPNAPKGCPESPDVENVERNTYFNYEGLGRYWYMNSWYGEQYGYQETRFFGFFDYEQDTNTVVFSYNGCVQPGDEVVIKYTMAMNDDDLVIVPDDLNPVLLQRTYYYFYMNSKPQLSRVHMNDFQRELRMYKRNLSKGYTYDDWLDWITSGYSNAAR